MGYTARSRSSFCLCDWTSNMTNVNREKDKLEDGEEEEGEEVRSACTFTEDVVAPLTTEETARLSNGGRNIQVLSD